MTAQIVLYLLETAKIQGTNLMMCPSTRHVTVTVTCFSDYIYFFPLVTLAETSRSMWLQTVHLGYAAQTVGAQPALLPLILKQNTPTQRLHSRCMYEQYPHTLTLMHPHALPFGLTLHGWAQQGGWGLWPSGRAISPCACTFHSHWTCS